MKNDSGRYYAFHVYDADDGRFLTDVVNEDRMAILRERDEYKAMGFVVKGDGVRDDDLMELSTGPLFETPMDYNEPLED
jgi:hypothetical protein